MTPCSQLQKIELLANHKIHNAIRNPTSLRNFYPKLSNSQQLLFFLKLTFFFRFFLKLASCSLLLTFVVSPLTFVPSLSSISFVQAILFWLPFVSSLIGRAKTCASLIGWERLGKAGQKWRRAGSRKLASLSESKIGWHKNPLFLFRNLPAVPRTN